MRIADILARVARAIVAAVSRIVTACLRGVRQGVPPSEPQAPVPPETEPPKLGHAGTAPPPDQVEVGPIHPGSDTSLREPGEKTEQLKKPICVSPVDRPPRRPRIGEQLDKPRPVIPRPRPPKPEVVCWKREREWVLAVEMPGNMSEKPHVALFQNGNPLNLDESETGCWRLAQLKGEVTICASENENSMSPEITLGADDYMVFKLSGGGGLNQGRRVKQATCGSCLAVVPATWERDEKEAGPAPAAPEPVCLEGYRAHFFDLADDASSVIAFRDQAGASVLFGAKQSRFRLVGERLIDASERVGPLFGGTPPRIQATNADVWKEVGIIIAGEEGRGQGRWRVSFEPDTTDGEQDLPPEIADRKAGWYFLRFYDAESELMESLDFRFATGLRAFSMRQPSPLPAAAGHTETTVELLHDSDWRLVPAPENPTETKIQETDGKTVLTIPALPTCDRSCWLLGPLGGPQVEVAILVERVWWAVSEANRTPSQWQDAPVSLRRDDLTAISEKAIWLRFPKRRWTDAVSAGFERANGRRYELKVTETTIGIPLRDFADTGEVGDRAREHSLKVWITRDNSVHEGVIGTIPADLLPKVVTIANVSAPHLASALTALRRATFGPLRSLIKEVRREYRRPRFSATAHSEEFVKQALCVIAVALRAAEDRQIMIPVLRNRWTSRARFAAREFPEVMRQVWSRYRELQR